MSKSLNKSQEIVNTKTTGGTRMGMMDYLKTVVALFLATAITASAVEIDGYDIREENDSGDWVTVESFGPWDTSSFTTLEEYETLINKHIDTEPGEMDSPAVHDRAHPGSLAIQFQKVLNEMLNRDIATPEQIFDWQINNIGAITNYTSGQDKKSGYAAKIPSAFDNIAAVDTTAITLKDELLESGLYYSIARISLTQVDNRNAFDTLWTLLENSDKIDQTSNNYTYKRVENYHLPLGNDQQAYDMMLNLAKEGSHLPQAAAYAHSNEIDRTEELLDVIVRNVESAKYEDSAFTTYLITIWNNLDWLSLVQSKTDTELQNMFEKYEIVVPRSATALRTAIANKKADVLGQ